MAVVRWSARANTALRRVRHGYEDAPRFGEALAEEILKATRRLGAFPRSGRVVPEVQDEAVRELLYRGYRVIYVVTSDDTEVDVLTVFHSSLLLGPL